MKSNSTSQLLLRVANGDSSAFDRLFGLVYNDLRDIASKHLAGSVLAQHFSSTDLVHEAYARLIESENQNWNTKTHFLSLGSKVMRQVLVDRARHNLAKKRGGGAAKLSLEEDLVLVRDDEHILKVNDALDRLSELDATQAKIVELRFFGGLTVAEVAELMGRSKRWVEAEWTMIRAWLRAELDEQE